MTHQPNGAADLQRSFSDARAFLRDEALPALLPDRQLRALKRKYVGYVSADSYRVMYALRFADEPRHWPRFAMVTIGDAKKLAPLYAKHYGSNGHSPSARALLHPSGGRMVEIFPASWRLPSLAQAIDPEEISAHLEEADAGRCAGVRIVRFRAHKSCVLRYAVESADGERELIGKVYPAGPKASDVWRKLVVLHEQAPASRLAVPKPLWFVDEWNFILMEPVPGDRFKDALKASETGEEMEEAAVTAANGLAAFQRLAMESDEVRTLSLLISKLRRRLARTAEFAPSVPPRFAPLIERASELTERLPDPVLCTIHGDFKPSQVFVGEEGVALVDLDRACRGDRALDVGSFLAVLDKKAMRPKRRGYPALGKAFVGAYMENVSEAGLLERARIAQGLSLARMALSKFESLAHDEGLGSDERAAGLLDKAASCLAEL